MLGERITILVEVDTDAVPGWGHDPQDYVTLIQRMLNDRIPYYNPTVELSQPREDSASRTESPFRVPELEDSEAGFYG